MLEAPGDPAAPTSVPSRRRGARAGVPAGFRVAEIYFERRGGRSIVGNIYKGSVDNVLPGPRGRLRRHRPRQERLPARRRDRAPRASRRRSAAAARSPARASTTCSSPGQEVVVQVVKDPLKTKGARLSMELTIAGRYMVYAPTGRGRRRLAAARRQGARPPAQGGQAARPRRRRRDHPHRRPGRHARRLRARAAVPVQAQRGPRAARRGDEGARAWSSRRPTSRCASCATSSPSTSSARSSTTPSSTIACCRSSRAPRPSSSTASSCGRTGRRRCSTPTASTRSSRACSPRRVDLPSGGYLMIDYAEALTVIDVNTGSFTGTRQAGPPRGHDHQDEPRGRRGGRQPAAAARHRRHHRHRLHRHGARAQPRRGAQDAAQGARRGPHEDLRGRDLAARAGRDDAPERHRRRARDHDQDVPDLRRRGRGQVRGDDRHRGRAASCASSSSEAGDRRPRGLPGAAEPEGHRTSSPADGARMLHALEDETGRLLLLRGLRGPAAGPLRGHAGGHARRDRRRRPSRSAPATRCTSTSSSRTCTTTTTRSPRSTAT